jgi:MYXO-CTERM domain-containing protein
MHLYVPDALFSAFGSSSTVTLYSQFGLQGVNPPGFTGSFGTSAGFEEWAVEEVPEPASASLALIVLGGLCTLRRRL